MKLNSKVYNIERTSTMRNAIRGRTSVDDALEYFFECDTKMLEKLIDVYNYNMRMYHMCGEYTDNILTVEKLRDIRVAAKFKISEDTRIRRQDRLRYTKLCDALLYCIADVTMVEGLMEFMRSNDAMSIESMLLAGDLAVEKTVEDDFLIEDNIDYAYFPFTVKKTVKEWREHYLSSSEEEIPSNILEKIYGNEEFITTNITNEKMLNTTLILITMSLSVAFNILYRNFELEMDYITLSEWITACMDSDMISSVLYSYCVTTSVPYIMDFIVHNIAWVTDALFRGKANIRKFINVANDNIDGPCDEVLIKKYFDIVQKDSI